MLNPNYIYKGFGVIQSYLKHLILQFSGFSRGDPVFKTLKALNVKEKKVILRAGFDVPLDDDGNITDDTRILAGLPTIKYLREQQAAIIIISHNHRPKGQVVEKLRNKNVSTKLSELLDKEVLYLEHVVGHEVREAASNLQPGQILMLENLRFDKREEEADDYFAKELAGLADFYVNDAFSNSHRNHASMTGIPKHIPGCVGLIVENEVTNLQLDNPKKPLMVVLGGVKLETKLPLIKDFLQTADKVLLGGAMIFTFYKAQEFEIGKSLCDDTFVEEAKRLLEEGGDKLVLPSDVVVADAPEENSPNTDVSIYSMPPDKIGLDIGHESTAYFESILNDAKTVIWNGPLGLFEKTPFDRSSMAIAKKLAEINAKTIAGGGDTAAVIDNAGVKDKISFVSTAGGASITMLEGKTLPAIAALEKNAELFFD